MDMAFFQLDGRVVIKDELANAYTEHSSVDAKAATNELEIICGKVLKYLLTARGTDAFDPTYGGRALHRTHISSTLLPEIRMELLEDIRDCVAYLKAGEDKAKAYNDERLYSITLVSLEYDRNVSPDTLHAHLLIRSNKGNTAVIKVDS